MDNISPLFVEVLIVAEDRRYRRHNGVDLLGVGRALITRLLRGKIEGASTIEQQYVRTLSGRYEKTVGRKFREWVSSHELNKKIDKEKIAKMYLCIAYFGARMNGVFQACAYLGIDPGNPNVEEAARVVASLKYPLPQKPSAELMAKHLSRVRHIVSLMEKRNEF